MGSSTDIMQTYISREIGSVYSSSSGWRVVQSSTVSGYNQVKLLEKIENGRREAVLLGISFDRIIPAALVSAMKQTSVQKSVYQSGPTRYEILVPKNADTSSLVGDCGVRYMNSFGFEGDALVWYKKPVQVTSPPKAS